MRANQRTRSRDKDWGKEEVDVGDLLALDFASELQRASDRRIECEECGEALATKWCTQCNDSFCYSCYEKIHRRGKRALHAYSNIDGQAVVHTRGASTLAEILSFI